MRSTIFRFLNRSYRTHVVYLIIAAMLLLPNLLNTIEVNAQSGNELAWNF